MTPAEGQHLEGGCTCGRIRYRMTSKPMFVHCCHCRWCQRETGSAFVINALIEADRIESIKDEPEIILTPTLSGRGQKIHRCPDCKVAVWSNSPPWSGAVLHHPRHTADVLEETGADVDALQVVGQPGWSYGLPTDFS